MKQDDRREVAGIPFTRPPAGKDLTEAPFDFPEGFKQEVLHRVARSDWHRYPPREQTATTAVVAEAFSLSPECVLLTRGCKEALRIVFQSEALAGHGILLPEPGYFIYPLLADSLGLPHRTYAVEDGAESASQADDRPWTRLVCSPNNPTGHVVPLDALARICARDGGCVVDLTYDPFAPVPLLPQLAGLLETGLVGCLSLSKAFGLAGARLGALVAEPARIRQLRTLMDTYALDYFQLAVVQTLFAENWTWARTALLDAVRCYRTRAAALVAGLLPQVQLLPQTANFVSFIVPAAYGFDAAVDVVRDCAHARFEDARLVRLTVNEQTLQALSRACSGGEGVEHAR
ncbi:aminotransferase class I/II-fold pyridoxal phosphate-dependent enzyme [Streptacidiphilus sp. PB12-B1b]|uniref:aminotransferase class I/II-fold pyridoxal phosphate-dependent enzyme n=1 Tax=Streptacidiphilus sp. PB12-B1b TaxID=2705012 RepID=UPI0015FB5D5E|nr:aminotransferase class I/II-fold pyridoxal phosphate-dependent enzyme [Streptacidiphilus sp. PB12-B1b]QMU78323.1 aminotransferase class I/II-fold pyridoxal phosphate-dependent enzyme [Streptacidiphilus sp. PB12-B1b]